MAHSVFHVLTVISGRALWAWGIPLRERGFGVVVVQYLFVVISFGSHHGGSYLAQTYAMSPARAVEDEERGPLLHLKCTAVEVCL
jgi:hypothetical protein